MKGREQHDRFLLSTFEGSPTCSAKAWVEELDTFLQHHQIPEDEAIKVVVLHMRGKAYASWIFESFSLRNVNTTSYASFTNALLIRFDRMIHDTHMVELNKGTQTKPLHENAIPLQKTMEEAEKLHHTLLEESISSHTFEQESMEVSLSKRDPIIGRFPIHVAEIEGNIFVSPRYYLVPHAEEGGALAPSRGILASL